jgi:hypothetical protein
MTVKLKDTLDKVNDSITLNRYDNGYMLEIGGRDSSDEWVTRKLLCNTLDEVIALITEYSKITIC